MNRDIFAGASSLANLRSPFASELAPAMPRPGIAYCLETSA
jgi:hypothetical protein